MAIISMLIVGLGNPGKKYELSRHNAGFRVIDRTAEALAVRLKKSRFQHYLIGKGRFKGKNIFLVKPLTYMNHSGEIFRSLIKKTGVSESEILVIYDNVEISTGNCRFKMKGSSGGHKGLESIIKCLGDNNFMRMSVGIGRPGENMIEHVLSRPGRKEGDLIKKAEEAAKNAIFTLILSGPEKVMNGLNKKEPAN